MLDPLDRAYPIFGDSSTRFEDAQSNSKLYARFDRGNSYAMFGDMESDQIAARNCKIPFYHVTYGFGETQNPDRSFKSFEDLRNFLS